MSEDEIENFPTRGRYVVRGHDENGEPLFQRWDHASTCTCKDCK